MTMPCVQGIVDWSILQRLFDAISISIYILSRAQDVIYIYIYIYIHILSRAQEHYVLVWVKAQKQGTVLYNQLGVLFRLPLGTMLSGLALLPRALGVIASCFACLDCLHCMPWG